MATYPSLAIDPKESRRIRRDGREEDVIGDGTVRVRKLHADRSDFEIKHPLLSSADVTTLLNFYTTNSAATTIDLVWPEDGVTYQVRFGKEAIRTQWRTATRRDAWVRLVAAG